MTKHRMVYDGDLTWRLSRTKTIVVHVVLFEDILVLLQPVDDKLVLRCHSRDDVPQKGTQVPVLKLYDLMIRDNAAGRVVYSFSLNTSNPEFI